MSLHGLWIFALLVICPLFYSKSAFDNALVLKLLALCVVAIAAIAVQVRQKTDTLSFSWLEMALVAYVALHFLSSFPALVKADALNESFKMAIMASLYLVFKTALVKDKTRALASIAISACLATFLAFGFAFEELMEAFRNKAPLRSSVYLVSGLQGHKNVLSDWFLVLLPLNWMGFRLKTKMPKLLFVLALVLQLLMIGLLQTRAVWVGLLLGGLLLIVLTRIANGSEEQKAKIVALLRSGFIGLLLLIGVISLLLLFDKFHLVEANAEKQSSSVLERLILWEKSFAMIKEHFLAGVGAGNWKILFPEGGLEGLYRATEGVIVFIRPHNDLVWVWAEIGFFGVLAYLALFFFSIKQALKKLSSAKAEEALVYQIGLVGLVMYFCISMFDFPKERVEFIMALALFLALASHQDQTAFRWSRLQSSLPRILILPVLAIATFFLWNRYQAEIHARNIISAKESGNYALMLKESEAASNYKLYYSMDHNGLPMSWYEGIAHYNLGNQAKAYALFKEAVELNPYNHNVINNAGTAYFGEKNYKAAEKLYLEALRINPKFNDAMLNLAGVYINLNQKEQARYWLNRVSIQSERLKQLKALTQ